jgi:hypothetical protein
MPAACTATHLWIMQSAANGAGNTTTFTLYKNGSATAITGTITNASGTGSIEVDSTHTVSFNASDSILLVASSSPSAGGKVGGWSFRCQ